MCEADVCQATALLSVHTALSEINHHLYLFIYLFISLLAPASPNPWLKSWEKGKKQSYIKSLCKAPCDRFREMCFSTMNFQEWLLGRTAKHAIRQMFTKRRQGCSIISTRNSLRSLKYFPGASQKIRNIWSEKPKPLSFDLFPLSFFSVVPLCRCWRPEGTRHSVCRCSYPAHKHYQTSIQHGSVLPNITHRLPIWPNQPSMFPMLTTLSWKA